MLDKVTLPASIFAALGSGIVAGIFYAFSSFVMAGLGRVAAPVGIASMQSISITVITPSFMVPFMGTSLVSAALVVGSILRWGSPGSGVVLVASVIYLIGSLGVTMVCNVPLNDALAALEPSGTQAAEFWPRYLQDWVFWNHVRTAASLAAAILFCTDLARLLQ